MDIVERIDLKIKEWCMLGLYTPKYLHLSTEFYYELLVHLGEPQIVMFQGLIVVPTFSRLNHISIGI